MPQCERRFTTYERVEEMLPLVVKKDGRREVFDREKIVAGLKKACEKRPVCADRHRARRRPRSSASSRNAARRKCDSVIGEPVMRELHKLDQVAYVRFASVYREFKDVDEFMRELQDLVKEGGSASGERRRAAQVSSGGGVSGERRASTCARRIALRARGARPHQSRIPPVGAVVVARGAHRRPRLSPRRRYARTARPRRYATPVRGRAARRST